MKSLSIALYPFIPESAQKIWSQLGMSGNVSEQSWKSISDITINNEHRLGTPSPLFVKIESSEIKTHKEKLGKQS